jgi:hypothetical protein
MSSYKSSQFVTFSAEKNNSFVQFGKSGFHLALSILFQLSLPQKPYEIEENRQPTTANSKQNNIKKWLLIWQHDTTRARKQEHPLVQVLVQPSLTCK